MMASAPRVTRIVNRLRSLFVPRFTVVDLIPILVAAEAVRHGELGVAAGVVVFGVVLVRLVEESVGMGDHQGSRREPE